MKCYTSGREEILSFIIMRLDWQQLIIHLQLRMPSPFLSVGVWKSRIISMTTTITPTATFLIWGTLLRGNLQNGLLTVKTRIEWVCWTTTSVPFTLTLVVDNFNGFKVPWFPHPNDLELHHKLTRIYDNVDQLQGLIYHSKKGLRITIPEDKWINWKNTSPSSQEQFTWVAWCQMTQFDKEAMMTGLIDGKLGDKPIYINFNNQAKHNSHWEAELSSVQSYMTKLVTTNRAYVHYNPLVIQDLATSQPLITNPWDKWKINHPSQYCLPYANILLLWNSLTSRWYYPTPGNEPDHSIDSPPHLLSSLSNESSQSNSSMEISSTNSYKPSEDQPLPLWRMKASAKLHLECKCCAPYSPKGLYSTCSPTDYMDMEFLSQQPLWYHNALPPTPHTTPVEDMI